MTRPFLQAAQFNATPVRTWPLAVLILAMQAVFCAALVWINAVAENVPGRRVADVLVADSAIASAETAVDFAPTRLVADRCCAEPGAVIRTVLTQADAALGEPTLLIVSAYDNAAIYLNGEQIGGQGVVGANVSLLGGMPVLVRIPRSMARPGARLDIAVQRAVGVAHLRPFHIGEYQALYPSFLALRVLRFDLLFLNAAFGAFLAGLCFCAAPLFGARGLLISLGALGASWTLQHVGLLATDTPWGAVANAGVYYAAFLATLICAVWFFVHWTSTFASSAPDRAGRPRAIAFLIDPWSPRDLRTLGVVSVLAIVFGTAAIAQRLTYDLAGASHAINLVINWFGLVAMAFCLVRIVAFYWRAGLRNPIEASAFLFVVIAALVDIASVRFFSGSGVFLGAAVTFFPLALLVSLAARARGVFEAATATAEQLNLLVAAREQELLAGMRELQKRERDSMLLEERSRIMRDMHDGIGGQLLGMILQARSNKLTGEGMIGGLEESLSDLRMVVDSLDQTEGSLANAVGAFRARIEPRCEAAQAILDWQIGDVGPTPNIGPDKILQIYRVLQEACTNALNHGRPKRIIVSLRRAAPGHVEVAVTDDGAGFDPETAKPGRGLSNMRARAQRIGAHLTISGDATGARVALDIEA